MGQSIAVAILFAGAVVWSVRRLYLRMTRKKKAGCEKCEASGIR